MPAEPLLTEHLLSLLLSFHVIKLYTTINTPLCSTILRKQPHQQVCSHENTSLAHNILVNPCTLSTAIRFLLWDNQFKTFIMTDLFFYTSPWPIKSSIAFVFIITLSACYHGTMPSEIWYFKFHCSLLLVICLILILLFSNIFFLYGMNHVRLFCCQNRPLSFSYSFLQL